MPSGCSRGTVENNQLNIFIKDSRGNKIAQKNVYGGIGYGYYRFKDGIKTGQKYTIEVYDFGGRQTQDFVAEMWAADSLVRLTNARTK